MTVVCQLLTRRLPCHRNKLVKRHIRKTGRLQAGVTGTINDVLYLLENDDNNCGLPAVKTFHLLSILTFALIAVGSTSLVWIKCSIVFLVAVSDAICIHRRNSKLLRFSFFAQLFLWLSLIVVDLFEITDITHIALYTSIFSRQLLHRIITNWLEAQIIIPSTDCLYI
ncbi:unnamed protein product [Caenorhabditis bovis]|uniref:Uncharacterized protein n=1 Tax=Caenorhabditis bovis TaxID=2654633 RepID=A0A8S1EVV4_9PELO|nr:unnamed protein product [Caenorhabditis bovis]